MDTGEVTFDETMPCTSLGFQCAGDEEMAKDHFEEEKDEVGDDDGENHAPEAECAPTTSPMTTTEMTMDMLYLMQTGSILCMRSWKILRGTKCGS
jgi:hypothetical protein